MGMNVMFKIQGEGETQKKLAELDEQIKVVNSELHKLVHMCEGLNPLSLRGEAETAGDEKDAH